MSRTVQIGLAQITGAPYDVAGNRALSVSAAREAFERGARLVVLPELIIPGYVANRELLLPIAEHVDGPSVRAWGQVAREHGGYVVGGLCERDGDRLYNTAVAVGPRGVVLHYRKLHPFREEKRVFEPGDLGLPIAETELGTIAVCICYDLRFVETLRVLGLSGAEAVCVPTAWVPGFDSQRWDAEGFCPQARGAVVQANLNQVYVACASQAGSSDGLELLGSSMLADPYGRVLSGPLPGDRDEIAVVTVDLDAVREAQVRDHLIAPRADRRTDVYALNVDGISL